MNVTLLVQAPFRDMSTGDIAARLRLLGISAAATHSLPRLGHPNATVSPSEGEIVDLGLSLPENGEEVWTEAKNQRRCDLIDRKYAGSLTPAEAHELSRLQAEMARERQRVAPLPLDELQRLLEQLSADSTAPGPTDP